MFGFVLNANRLFSDLKDKWGGGGCVRCANTSSKKDEEITVGLGRCKPLTGNFDNRMPSACGDKPK